MCDNGGPCVARHPGDDMNASDPHIGRILAGKFALESRIGSGAMGSVYTARHLALRTQVAVKLLHLHMAGDARCC